MATFVWAAAANSTWATGGNWKVGGVAQAAPPTNADDVLFGSGTGATNFNCTLAAGDVCKSADFTGYTGVLTLPSSVTWSLSGGLILSTGMTFTQGSNTTSITAFVATDNNGGGGYGITQNSKSINTITFTGVGGKWVFQDAIAHSATNHSVTISNGDVDFGSITHSVALLVFTGSAARTIRSTGTLNLTGSGVVFSGETTTNLTWLATTMNVNITNTATATQRTISGGGLQIGTLTYSADSQQTLFIRRGTGSGTLAAIRVAAFVTTPGKWIRVKINQTFTVDPSGWQVTSADWGYIQYWGQTGSYISTPDHADFDITGDLEIVARVQLADWTPGAINTIIGKYDNTVANGSYRLAVLSNGKLQLDLSDGTTQFTPQSSVATGISDGSIAWIKVTRRQSDGRIQFFTAADNGSQTEPTFTQLGTNITSTTNALVNSTTNVQIGQYNAATNPLTGRIYRTIIRSGIGGTIVGDFDADAHVVGQDTYADTAGTSKTWTLNGQLVAGDGRTQIDSDSAGTAGIISVSSGTVSGDYMRIKDSTATGGAAFYAGANSVDVSGNTGWIFTAPPAGGPRRLALMGVG